MQEKPHPPKSKDEGASSAVHPKRMDEDELGSRAAPPAEMKREHGDSAKEAPLRPLQSLATELVEEHSEGRQSPGDIVSDRSDSDNVQVTVNDGDEVCQIVASATTGGDHSIKDLPQDVE